MLARFLLTGIERFAPLCKSTIASTISKRVAVGSPSKNSSTGLRPRAVLSLPLAQANSGPAHFCVWF